MKMSMRTAARVLPIVLPCLASCGGDAGEARAAFAMPGSRCKPTGKCATTR